VALGGSARRADALSLLFALPALQGRHWEIFMVNTQRSGSFRRWEDLASILLGIVAAAAAVFLHPTLAIVANAAVTGLVIVSLAALDLTVPPHWEEPFEMVAGTWLMVSPVWLGYGGPLRITHVVIGFIVAILAAIEFWQDRESMKI
jgi:hypothetical protein